MKKNTSDFDKFTTALIALFNRIYDHSQKCLQQGQPFGVCTIAPKHAGVAPPSVEIKEQIQRSSNKVFSNNSSIWLLLKIYNASDVTNIRK